MNTQNPPQTNLNEAKAVLPKLTIALAVLAVLFLAAVLTTSVTSGVFYFLCILPLILAYNSFSNFYSLRAPFPLTSHTFNFSPALKNREKLFVEILFQFPPEYNFDLFIDRLRIATAYALTTYFLTLETPPGFKEVEEHVIQAVDHDLSDVEIPVLRCRAMRVENPPPPPPPSPPPSSPPEPPTFHGIIIGKMQ